MTTPLTVTEVARVSMLTPGNRISQNMPVPAFRRAQPVLIDAEMAQAATAAAHDARIN